jgi:hypothetical protein
MIKVNQYLSKLAYDELDKADYLQFSTSTLKQIDLIHTNK